MSQLNTAMNQYNKAVEKSKSTMELVRKFQDDLMKALNQSLSDLDTFKQDLISIILNEKSDEDKLQEVRICILKFNPIELKLTFPSSDSQVRDKLNEMALLVVESIQEYGQFKEKVADIIRDTDMTTENKIEKISNILM